PPMYWSTGIQYAARSSTMVFASGQAKRRKYQDESTNVSMVSVSRPASAPRFGHFTFMNPGVLLSGLSEPSLTMLYGNTTGRSCSGTGTSPHLAQWMSGTGQPQ